jgi:hypothetical protein
LKRNSSPSALVRCGFLSSSAFPTLLPLPCLSSPLKKRKRRYLLGWRPNVFPIQFFSDKIPPFISNNGNHIQNGNHIRKGRKEADHSSRILFISLLFVCSFFFLYSASSSFVVGEKKAGCCPHNFSVVCVRGEEEGVQNKELQ